MNNKTLIDISWPISQQMTTYKNKHDVTINSIKNFPQDTSRESTICCGLHTGTHIDAPAHFIPNGKTIEQYPLSHLIAPCIIIDCTHVKECITDAELIHDDIHPGDIVLLKTSNSLHPATAEHLPHFIFLHESGARYLAKKHINAVGIDYLGIERDQAGHPTHKALLEQDMLIIEGLRLLHAPNGRHHCSCIPLAIQQTEAAPARAFITILS